MERLREHLGRFAPAARAGPLAPLAKRGPALSSDGSATPERYAKAEQLNVEYDPAPPFQAGTLEGAGPVVAQAMQRMYRSTREQFSAAAAAAAKKLGA